MRIKLWIDIVKKKCYESYSNMEKWKLENYVRNDNDSNTLFEN